MPGTLRTAFACFAFLTALWAAPAHAQTVQLADYPTPGATFASPFYVTAPPGDTSRVFVVEAAGTVRLVKDGVEQPTPFLDIAGEVHLPCECGMFSIAFAPDYATSGLLYATYTRDVAAPDEHELVLEEFRRSASNPDVTDPTGRREVLVIPHLTASNHNGGQLQYGPDGFLYWSVGDGGNTPNLAQDLNSLLGKLLRIDPRGAAPGQYSIPPDNPFADGPGGGADEVYSYGLRNPYRFSFDRGTGDLIIGDVGGGDLEEVDYMPEGTARGANFGWPCFEGNIVHQTSGPCSPPLANHTPPVHVYANPPAGGAAIMGGYVVRDGALPSLVGRYLYTDTYDAVPGIRAINLFPGGSSGDGSLGVSASSPVSFGEDACAHVYVASVAGTVSRLQPTSDPFPCSPTTAGLRLTVDTRNAAKALKRKGIPVIATCDRDCDVRATGSIGIGGGSKARASLKLKIRKTLVGSPASLRVQRSVPTVLLLKLSGKQRRVLAKALSPPAARLRVRVEATATGTAGGTATATAKRPLRTKK